MIIWNGIEHEKYNFDRSTNNIIGPHRKTLKLIPNNGYLRFQLCKNGKKLWVLFHRFIYYMYFPVTDWEKLKIDHMDRNKLNNSPENLRLVNSVQNSLNIIYNGKNKYHCVHPNGNKFHVRIRVNGELKYFGSFDNELEGAKHYNEVIKTLPNYEYRIKNDV